jgi:hypothetical protein
MAFEVAYSLKGEVLAPAKDFPLDTVANYGTGGAKKGDLVINNGGNLRRAVIASTVASVVGVLVGKEFMGLVAQGQEYAATNASITASALGNANGTGKVILDKSVVYRVPVAQAGAIQTATAAHRNATFAIAVVNNDQQIDLNNTAGSTQLVKVVDIAPNGKSVFVTLV